MSFASREAEFGDTGVAVAWDSVVDGGTVEVHFAVDQDIVGARSEFLKVYTIGASRLGSHQVFHDLEVFSDGRN